MAVDADGEAVLLTSPAVFNAPPWRALFRRRLEECGNRVGGAGVNVEQHPAWLAAWAEAFRLDDSILRVVAVRGQAKDGAEVWTAAGAFYLAREGPLRVLRFVGSGPCLYDRQDLTAAPGRAEEAGARAAEVFLARRGEWDAVELEYVPEGARAAAAFLRRLGAAGLRTTVTEADRVPHTAAYPDFRAYREAELSKKLWRDLRRRRRRLTRFGTLRFEQVGAATEEINRRLFEFHALHTLRWRAAGRASGVLDSFPQLPAFHAALLRRAADFEKDGAHVRFERLYLAETDETLAYHLGFRCGATTSFAVPAANPTFLKHEAGKLLLLAVAEDTFGGAESPAGHALDSGNGRHNGPPAKATSATGNAEAEGAFRLELGRGEEDYKRRWAEHSFAVRTLRAYKRGRGVLFSAPGRKAMGAAAKVKNKSRRAAERLTRRWKEGRRGRAAVYPELLEKLPGKRLLCLAPHPDDEVVGCGGTLRKHIVAGDEVTVVYLTDGAEGDSSGKTTTTEARRRFAARRAAEARAGLKVLGIERAEFLNLPDFRLAGNLDAAAEKLTTVWVKTRPEVVCLPHPFDDHPDHAAVGEILRRVVAGRATEIGEETAGDFLVAAYEVWTPVRADTLVNITQQMTVKEEALRRHESQTAALDYIEKIRGLNAYRSLSRPKLCRFAEAFRLLDWSDFAGLIARPDTSA